MRNRPRPGDTILDRFYDQDVMRWFSDIDQPWLRFGPKSKAHFPIQHAQHDGFGALCSHSFMRLDETLIGPVPGIGTCITCTDMIIRRTQGEKMPTVPTRLDLLQAQADRIQTEIARLAALPKEPDDPEAVIYFIKTFGTSREYAYAAVKANGMWWTSGPKSKGSYTWESLIEWITGDGDEETQVWVVSEWAPLV